MIDYQDFFTNLAETELAPWCDSLPELIAGKFSSDIHGDLARWVDIYASQPCLQSSDIDLKDQVRIGREDEVTFAEQEALRSYLRHFMPWRKGPFDLFGIKIDTEWRSDWKWQRIAPHISPLQYRRVLDVGCGSGYHCWRMAGEGAAQVIGIDPSLLFIFQFRSIKQLMVQPPNVELLPLRLEEMPELIPAFDTVFSMGVLYHRRSPLDHLMELRSCLKPNGELVLETLVIDGPLGEVLMPEKRYAKMGNVWFIPTPATLELWLRRLGFKDIRLIDLNQTTLQEQRATEWMTFESLDAFLDPNDRTKTIEGYPAPKRATFIARI